MSKSVIKEIEDFKRKLLADRLSQCTQKQQDFFNYRVYPNGVPEGSLVSAIDLVNRTLAEAKEKSNGD